MKLSYRGISYDVNPSSLQYRGAKQRSTNVSQTRALNAILTYRGATYAVAPSTQAAPVSSDVPAGTVLTYRGFSYTIQPTASVAPAQATVPSTPAPAVDSAAPAFSIQEQARVLTMNHHRSMQKRQQVMLVRSAAEVGMASTATSHWERLQETFNPVLQATYDRSHVALS